MRWLLAGLPAKRIYIIVEVGAVVGWPPDNPPYLIELWDGGGYLLAFLTM